MIIGIDIGGTKTLLVRFLASGAVAEEVRFETVHNYDKFLEELRMHAAAIDSTQAAKCVVAVPGLINRKAGIVESLGNLPWKNKPIAKDISTIFKGLHTVIENDSKLAGLAEAQALPSSKRTLYITISTGINAALVIDGHLSTDVIDMEIGKMPLYHAGASTPWEDFASGRAFIKKYGKRGEEVSDTKIWKAYTKDVAEGVLVACSIFQPETLVFGGGFGQYAEQFIPLLHPYIKKLHPNIRKPREIVASRYGDKSAIHGCYLYGKEQL